MIASRSLLLLLLISGFFSSPAQQVRLASLDSLSGFVINQIRQNETEKAYLSTDKTIYTAGEPVWFRSFLVRSLSEKISIRSKYLFVDLVNQKDSVFSKAVLYAKNQQTGGRLLLPDALPTGQYWLRAFTRSMVNGYPQNAAVVPVYVINPAEPNPVHTIEKSGGTTAGELPVNLQVFAEGGAMVTGINTGLCILAYDKAANPIALTGSIKDNMDAVVASFNTNQLGLAKTEFSPDSRKRYKAVVSHEGKEYNVPLPAFNPFAGQLSVSRSGNDMLKLRTVLEDSIYSREAITYVLGVSRDSVCFASSGSGNYETAVPLSAFPSGIASFLLFDKQFKLLSERSVYISEGQLTLTASLDKSAYVKRSKAILSTSITTKAGQPVPASLTVAVSAEPAWIQETYAPGHLLQKAKTTRLSNWDLLRLENLAESDIDLLLMVGPSVYSTAIAGKPSANEMAMDSLFSVHGQITTRKGEPVVNQPLTLMSATGEGIFVQGTTNTTGRFSFALPDYPDSTQFALQLDNRKGKGESLRVILQNMAFPRFSTPDILKKKWVIPSSRRMAYLRHYADTTSKGKGWLDPVTLRTKEKPYQHDPRRLTSGGSVLTSEQLMELGMGNVGTAVLRLPGVQLINGYLRFYGPDQFSGATANSEPMVLLDGNQMSLSNSDNSMSSSPVIQFLNTLNPREIDFIEVLKGPEASVYGLRGGEGVIHIHSSSHVHEDFSAKEGNVYKFLRPGYARPAMFPAADYGQKAVREKTALDTRSTLFWNENELSGKDGKAVFTFFTSDVAGTFQVLITGITAGGDLIYKTLSFTNR